MSSLSLLLIPIATTLIILSTATGQILDTRGKLLRNGDCVRLFANGGYIGEIGEGPEICSRKFVGLRMDRATPPLTYIYHMTTQGHLKLNQDLAIDYGYIDIKCRRTGVWQLDIDRATSRLVVTIGGFPFKFNSRFQIKGPVGHSVPFKYKIVFCPKQGSQCIDLKILKNNYLGIGKGSPLLVTLGNQTSPRLALPY